MRLRFLLVLAVVVACRSGFCAETRGMVASVHAAATDAGVETLRSGGNAVSEPDFGTNVFVLDPGRADSQQTANEIFGRQERAQFGTGRCAFLLKPGRYTLDMPVGFYTHVADVGKLPATS